MQNEALLALNLIIISNLNNNQIDLAKLFLNADIGKHIAFMINKYNEKMEIGTIENLLTLIEQLTKFTIIKTHLHELKVDEALKIFENHKCLTNSEKLVKLIQVLNIK